MKKSVLILLTVAAFTIFYSCKKSSTSSFDTSVCTGTTVSYSADVAPIFNTYCNKSGCHSYTSYTLIKNESARIYAEVASGSMPRGSSMSASDKQKLLCWINNGALNN